MRMKHALPVGLLVAAAFSAQTAAADPLSKFLDRFRTPAPPKPYYASWTPNPSMLVLLTEEELLEMFVPSRMWGWYGRSYYPGLPYAETVDKDGSVIFTDRSGTLSGVARVDDGRICFSYPDVGDDRFCTFVYAYGDCVVDFETRLPDNPAEASQSQLSSWDGVARRIGDGPVWPITADIFSDFLGCDNGIA